MITSVDYENVVKKPEIPKAIVCVDMGCMEFEIEEGSEHDMIIKARVIADFCRELILARGASKMAKPKILTINGKSLVI